MKDSPERDLAVADELGRMADARIKELEESNTALRDQLAQADETNRLAGLQIVELESRLAQVEKERDELRAQVEGEKALDLITDRQLKSGIHEALEQLKQS